MRAHNNTDAHELARLLTGEKIVICAKHGAIPINLIGHYFQPTYPACPVCIAEFYVEKFPVEIKERICTRT